MIAGLPLEGQLACFDLIDRLEQGPAPRIEPFGIDDGLTRCVTFGDDDEGFLVGFFNPDTGEITPTHLTWWGSQDEAPDQ